MTLLRRAAAIELRAAQESQGPIRLLASTDEILIRGRYYREQLLHGADNVTIAADTVLRNHDPDQIVGRVDGAATDGTQIHADVTFAGTALGRETEELVRGNFLRGVSIGYSIEAYDLIEDSEADTITLIAKKWTLREISLTPIPADLACGVGRDADHQAWADALALTRSTPAAPAPTTPAGLPGRTPEPIPMDPVAPAGATPAPVTPTPTADHARAAKAERTLELAKLARSHGVDVDFAELEQVESREAGLQLLLQRKATATAPAPTAAPGGRATITVDERDKAAEEACVRILAGAPGKSTFARAINKIRGGFLDESALFDALFGQRDVQVVADFANIAGLATRKAAITGFGKHNRVWTKWADRLVVPDFKTARTAGATVGDYAAASGGEGTGFADEVLKDVGGSGAATLRGKVRRLSEQAIKNDEIGIFLRTIQMEGMAAARHEDITAETALAAASHANATQALAYSTANLKLAWAAFVGITDANSIKVPYTPRLLLLPSALVIGGLEDVTSVQGEATARILAMNELAMEAVHLRYLADANDWYLAAGPAEGASPITVVVVDDYVNGPKITPIDTGAVAGFAWRIQHGLGTITNFISTGKPVGSYKCTVS